MSQKIFQITEKGEKVITDAFYATVEHGYPPPSCPAGEAEAEFRILCAGIVLSTGMPFSQLVKDAGLNDLERNLLLLSFATITLAYQLRDAKLIEAVSQYLRKTGLADRIDPHLDMSDIDEAIVERQMQEDMANLEPKPLLKISIECCDDQPESDTECCTDDE